jgi:hypothetical protein
VNIATLDRRHFSVVRPAHKLIRGNDRISRLVQRPDIATDVAQIRADTADADRTYAIGMAALRQAARERTGDWRHARAMSLDSLCYRALSCWYLGLAVTGLKGGAGAVPGSGGPSHSGTGRWAVTP